MGVSDWIQLVMAIATAAAVAVAAVAIFQTRAIVRRDRSQQLLRDRLAEALSLLEAFEVVRSGDLAGWSIPGTNYDLDTPRRAHARLFALLSASEEPLPEMRKTFLERGLQGGVEDKAWMQTMQKSLRDEILSAIAGLRERLEA